MTSTALSGSLFDVRAMKRRERRAPPAGLLMICVWRPATNRSAELSQVESLLTLTLRSATVWWFSAEILTEDI